jgi:hypothetical protein
LAAVRFGSPSQNHCFVRNFLTKRYSLFLSLDRETSNPFWATSCDIAPFSKMPLMPLTILAPERGEKRQASHSLRYGIEAGQFQSSIDVVEKVTRLSRMKYAIRFVANEKLSRHDKLLLAFDAYTLSLALGTTPTIGKIMHGMDQRTVTIRLAPLISVVRLMVEKICSQTANPRTSTTCLEQALY